ncbi:nucleotidyltransferase domain-containing protein [Streptomyces sp. NPDC057428]|uniref:nucleotidyltransferase domain-containing protein n=1 Tax=Streptomyces sp. NPDC057428 TaxID=3346129 RepID=UPI0036CC3989
MDAPRRCVPGAAKWARGTRSCFVAGVIGTTSVRCVSAEQQARFHQGCTPADRDVRDMAHLRDKFGIETAF